jgi:hypothetical protein
VLAVPADTAVVAQTLTPPGVVLVRPTDGTLVLDEPTQGSRKNEFEGPRPPRRPAR